MDIKATYSTRSVGDWEGQVATPGGERALEDGGERALDGVGEHKWWRVVLSFVGGIE